MCEHIYDQLLVTGHSQASAQGSYYECSRTADAWARKGWKATCRSVGEEFYEAIVWRTPNEMPDERTLWQKFTWWLQGYRPNAGE